MLRGAALGVVMAATLIVAGCTRTSGYPPASCAAATDLARDHINTFAEQLTPGKWPAVIAIENPVETKLEKGTGRYKVRRFCAADARMADGSRGRALYVISDKQEGWLGGFGFYACIVGRSEDCKEDGT
jgi:hypothetical protein